MRQLLGNALRLNIYGKQEGKKSKLEKKKLSVSAISMKVSGNSVGSYETGITLWMYPELRRKSQHFIPNVE